MRFPTGHGGRVVWSMCQILVDVHSKTRFQIPARDNNINRSESEMACHYSNIRAPCDMCRLRYQTERRCYPALELHSWAASSVGVTSTFQWSQQRKQIRWKADNKKKLSFSCYSKNIWDLSSIWWRIHYWIGVRYLVRVKLESHYLLFQILIQWHM